MPARAWLLVSWVLVGAAILVVHAIVLFQALRSKKLSWRLRLAALLPPIAPLAAWMDGRRVSPVLWAALIVLYLVLRALG